MSTTFLPEIVPETDANSRRGKWQNKSKEKSISQFAIFSRPANSVRLYWRGPPPDAAEPKSLIIGSRSVLTTCVNHTFFWLGDVPAQEYQVTDFSTYFTDNMLHKSVRPICVNIAAYTKSYFPQPLQHATAQSFLKRKIQKRAKIRAH